ncbi:MAG: thermonuclease family protein [Ottowia sp.]|uniref:thermonuclease family protein n=1 Tax=Ottowia sp. TaxID=1898956 RepID=UPI0039E50BA2
MTKGAAACAFMLAALLGWPHASARADAPWAGRVSHVVDGDSLWVRAEDGRQRVRVRLDGVDAPEICQSGGEQARQALQALVLGQAVRVRVRAYDRYHRAIAEVARASDGLDVGARMVEEGWAWSEGFRGRAGKYQREADLARRQGLGLFQDAAPPETPAGFRRRHGVCAPPGSALENAAAVII